MPSYLEQAAGAAAATAQPSARRRRLALVLAASALATLPVWLTTFPPMVDYPQHLAMAAMIRWWGDTGRGFAETYRLVWAAPQSLFEWLAAGAAWVLPIATAGKLAVAVAIAAVGPAALAVTRRLGRPDWYALLPLTMTLNYAYSWGFVGTLFAYPLFLAGLAAADRLLGGLGNPADASGGRFGPGAWLSLAALTSAFYLVHLQLLLLFAAAVAWLVAVRRPGYRRALAPLSALVPGLLVVTAVVLLPNLVSPETSFSPYELSMKAVGTRWHPLGLKLYALPGLVFGPRRDLAEGVLAAVMIVLALVLVAGRSARKEKDQVREDGADSDAGESSHAASGGGHARGDGLFRARFAAIAAGMLALYLILPERLMGYLVAERLAPLAAMLLVLCLPPPPSARAPTAKALAAALLVLHLGLAAADAAAFERDAAGLSELLSHADEGRRLAGLIYDPYLVPSTGPVLLRYPVYTHFPALYQALRGGRVLFSFAELSHSVVQYRTRPWPPDLLSRVADRSPRAFSLAQDGPHFDYLLARGDWPDVRAALGFSLSEWEVRSVRRWHLFRRRSGSALAVPGAPPPSRDGTPSPRNVHAPASVLGLLDFVAAVWHTTRPSPRAPSRASGPSAEVVPSGRSGGLQDVEKAVRSRGLPAGGAGVLQPRVLRILKQAHVAQG